MTQQHDDWQIILRHLSEQRISAVHRGDDYEVEYIEGQFNEFYADLVAYMRGHNQHGLLMEESAPDH